ncbi:MAG: tail fiber domain-containing protein, partial [Alphaproteobacteria bacterium]
VTAARWSADNGGPGVNLYKSRGAAVGTHGIVSSGDSGGGNTWRFSDGVGFIPAAAIRAAVDGTPGVNDMPGRLMFSTTLDGAAALSERMRITNDGKFGFGTTGPSNFASFEGIAAPQTDNAYTCGTASKRWSDVYAVSGTVNTSDARLKTDIEDSRLGLAFILNCRPRSYRWLEGGVTVEWDEEAVEEEVPVTEERTVLATVVEVRDGVAVARQVERTVRVPVVDHLPVVDEAGQPVLVDGEPAQHAVPRMARSVVEMRPVKREVKRAGGRTHYGLVAQEVQAAAAMAGVTDFAGWVLADKGDPDSTQGLRYDQFIAPLIKAVQELAARVVALEARRTAS